VATPTCSFAAIVGADPHTCMATGTPYAAAAAQARRASPIPPTIVASGLREVEGAGAVA
jgi:hypothetical protein